MPFSATGVNLLPPMPITKSAKKALRASANKRVFNLRRDKAMKEAIKEFVKAPSAKLLPTAYQAIDKAMKRGVIKAATAARKKYKLAMLLKGKK